MAIITPLKKRWLWQCWRTETNGSCATGGGGTSLLYKEVPISSAEILTIGTVPIELLPQLPEGQYYDNVKMNLEYKFVTTPYVDGNTALIINSINASFVADFSASPYFAVTRTTPFAATTDTACIIDGTQTQGTTTVSSLNYNARPFSANIADPQFSDLHIYATGSKGAPNPSGGDGTMLVKIWYEIRNIGSEL
jgi:hypothetical protein